MATFKEVYEKWKVNKANFVKRSTLSAYILLCENHILPTFENKEEITEQDLQEFVLSKINGGSLGAKSVKDVIIVVKMVLKFGVKYNMWAKLPTFDIQYPVNNMKVKIDTFNNNDYKKIVLYTKDNFTFRNLGVLIVLSTGMRIGEICALQWKDFNLHDGTLVVSKTIQRIYMIEDGKRRTELIIDEPKTKNSHREIPLTKDLLAIIKSLSKFTNPNFYVLTNEEKPTEPRTYRAYYHNLMNKLGIPPIKFHGMRHSFATAMIETGTDVKTVSTILGHSNVATTFNLYVHPTAEQKRGAIDKLFKKMK